MANIKKPVAPILDENGRLHRDWADRFQKTFDAISGPLPLGSFTVATVPDPTKYAGGHFIYVSNESGGAVTAFSDGTHWRRTTDRAIIS